MRTRTRVIRPGWGSPPAARIAAAAAAAAMALPGAAFGRTPSATAAGGSSKAQLSSTDVQRTLAFARCMRSHGVPRFPDPNGSGVLPKRTPQQLGVSNSRFETAEASCSHLLPSPALPFSGQPTQAELRKLERDALNFARCMRAHGVTAWPDYILRGGIPIFDLHGTSIPPNSPQIAAEQLECKTLLHVAYSPPTSGGSA